MDFVNPPHASLNLLLRDTIRIGGTGFEPGMQVHFQTVIPPSGRWQQVGDVLEVSDTLIRALPPLPQVASEVSVWVLWPPVRVSRFESKQDSMRAPGSFAFVGPDLEDERVYDYGLHAFDRYEIIRWRLEDPELAVWFDPIFPPAYREQILAGFRRWQGILPDTLLDFREIDQQGAADIHVISQARISAYPTIDREAMRLKRVTIDLPFPATDPAPPGNYLLSAVHEMGHALGLWAHSPYVGDVMSTFQAASVPTERDVATLRHLYEQPLGITDR